MDMFVSCPHCGGPVVVNEKDINCKIFRHAVHKNTLKPINPHASKEVCDRLVHANLVYGCCKPFELVRKNNKWEAVMCDYK